MKEKYSKFSLSHFQGCRGLNLGHHDGGPGHSLRAKLQQGRPGLGPGLQAVGQEASH